ncbi:Rv3235 family protein [Polymorphospora lycopeni]|uniref:Rv3235 family protein n=1 Tax=Polymorphospora lycopeni TaxID=3140240 RepID=A0ABV5D0Q5_9ACTN
MRATLTRPPARQSVRVRAVPPLDPPYDDESPRDPWSQLTGAGQLTLDLAGTRPPRGRRRESPPALPVPRPGVRPAHGPGQPGAYAAGPAAMTIAHPELAAPAGAFPASSSPAGRVPADGSVAGPPAGPGTASPEARQAARRFLGTCLEVFNGYRPVSHLRRLCVPGDAEAVVERITAANRRFAGPRSPVRGRSGQLLRPRLLRVSEPLPGIAEATAVLDRAGRVRAMAYRLERRRGVWLGTTAQLI